MSVWSSSHRKPGTESLRIFPPCPAKGRMCAKPIWDCWCPIPGKIELAAPEWRSPARCVAQHLDDYLLVGLSCRKKQHEANSCKKLPGGSGLSLERANLETERGIWRKTLDQGKRGLYPMEGQRCIQWLTSVVWKGRPMPSEGSRTGYETLPGPAWGEALPAEHESSFTQCEHFGW